jgi:uncharacterized protein (UPF0276 family)
MRPLGVGLVVTPQLLPLIHAGSEAVPVVEIEPQTLWQLSRPGGAQESYFLNEERCAELAALPQPRLLHSVGLPFGGSRPLQPSQIDLLRRMIALLNPAWVSDHLSFNAMDDGDRWCDVGFFLPPRQTSSGVAVAAAKLRAFADALNMPVAFETGVNYLRRQPDEMPDGEFFASVAGAADCGILLDLHNLYANQRNGRANARDVLAQLPLHRVWEVHVAGGMAFEGHWLDAHSGAVPEAVLDLAAEWIPLMPSLGALVFEILDEHVGSLGLDGVARQVEQLRPLWELRSSTFEIHVRPPGGLGAPVDGAQLDEVRAWERVLGALAIGRSPQAEMAARLAADPGIGVFRQLVADSRAAFIAQGLRYTTTLLLCTVGAASLRGLLAEFMQQRPPQLFASAEADAFASFLHHKGLSVPYLTEVLGFEHALIRAALYDEDSTVTFAHEPTALLESLEQGRLPSEARPQQTTLIVSVRG